jgi:signal peptidase II
VDARGRRSAVLLLGTGLVVLLLDQATKALAVARLADAPIEVIPGVLTLRYTTNTGGAFSMFTDAPWFFAAASIAVCVAIVVFAFRPRPPVQALALGLVLGGALGNLADRTLRGPGLSGEVVDFIDVSIWPVFNLADSALVVGAIVLAFGSFRRAAPDDVAADPAQPPAGSDG